MKVMILCAGRGERMRPLTDHKPKPLLEAGGKPLVVRHIERLASAGLRDIVINHAWLGGMLEEALGDGAAWGVQITYSPERVALETAGGIANAMSHLGPDPFLVINGDIHCCWDPGRAPGAARRLVDSSLLAWRDMVPNTAQHPRGDFSFEQGFMGDPAGAAERLTYSGIGVYRPALFAAIAAGARASLAPLLREAMAARHVAGERFDGHWTDVGTPARLADLDFRLRGAREQA